MNVVNIIVIHTKPVGVVMEQFSTSQMFYVAYHTSVEEAETFVAKKPPAHYQAEFGEPIDLLRNNVFIVLHAELENRAEEIKASFGLSGKPHVIGTAESMQAVAGVDATMEEEDAIFSEWIEQSGVPRWG